jgi:hypothetical protein
LRRIIVVAVTAVVACLVFGSTAPAASKEFKFAGRTNQCPSDQGRCGDVAITLSSNLKKVTSFFVEFQAKCDTQATPITDSLNARNFTAKVAAHTVKFTHDEASSLDLGHGFTGAVTAKLTGKIRAASGNGSGTLSLDIAVKNASGQQVDTCSTGRLPVGWKVKVV